MDNRSWMFFLTSAIVLLGSLGPAIAGKDGGREVVAFWTRWPSNLERLRGPLKTGGPYSTALPPAASSPSQGPSLILM